MTYVVVDICYYLVWPLVFVTRLWRQSLAATEELLVLMFSMPLVVIMELRNEYLQAGSGVYYPASLLYFPGFRFPLTIMLSSSLYAWILFAVSRKIAVRLVHADSWLRIPAQLGAFLLLNILYLIPEWLGVAIGYWQWHQPLPDTPQVWISKYLFYLWFSLPPALVALFFTWRQRIQSRRQAPPGKDTRR